MEAGTVLNLYPEKSLIILAGATGNLGGRIARFLLQRGAKVKALIRAGNTSNHIQLLKKPGLEIVEVDFNNELELSKACEGGLCVVSALSGLDDVIIDVQTRLLNAALKAGVQRFIPSDYCIDYTKLSPGSNRNLDLRRQFSEQINKTPINATSILNGMFSDLLVDKAPLILYKIHRIMFWGSADQPMDFTTMDDTAAFTAAAALDISTPRFLCIAGDVISARELKQVASDVTGNKFHLLRLGGLNVLHAMIKITRALSPKKKETFPAWQGMQYLRDMLSGDGKLHFLDNQRYPDLRWTSVKELLSKNYHSSASS